MVSYTKGERLKNKTKQKTLNKLLLNITRNAVKVLGFFLLNIASFTLN